MDKITSTVEKHYQGGGKSKETLRAALTAKGLDPDHLELDDLTMIEEFHSMGREGTIRLADVAKISDGERVLDVGCGIGGPARMLAKHYGAQVTGVDLTEDFCDIGRMLNTSTGLDDKVELRQANAVELPFDDGSFDVVWTQHVSQNISDKAASYGEMRRVVRDGGRLAFFDLQAGPEQPIHFPVPWADDDSTSFLVTPDETRGYVERAGFRPSAWNDLTPNVIGWLDQMATMGPPPEGSITLGILLTDFPTRVTNFGLNVRENRVQLLQAVCDAI
jgi:SAM-dependent methyltransferase